MFRVVSFIAANSPEPFPSASGLDESKVTPGVGGAAAFTFLAVALVLLLISMNRRMKKVNFEETKED